jgi:hypothetical protein
MLFRFSEFYPMTFQCCLKIIKNLLLSFWQVCQTRGLCARKYGYKSKDSYELNTHDDMKNNKEGHIKSNLKIDYGIIGRINPKYFYFGNKIAGNETDEVVQVAF